MSGLNTNASGVESTHKPEVIDKTGAQQGPNGDVKGFERSERKMIGRTDQVYVQNERVKIRADANGSCAGTTKRNADLSIAELECRNPTLIRFTKYVIVVRRQINKDGFPSGIKVDVRGPRLQKALLDLNKDTKGFGFEEDPQTVDTKILFHSLDGLERLLSEAENESPVDAEKVFELKAGIQFVHEEFADTFTSLKTLLPNNQINFENLWTLYPPNTIVCAGDAFGHMRGYKVSSTKEATDQNGLPWLYLDTDYIDSDGVKVGWVRGHTLRIPWFLGVKDIWSLAHIPFNMGPEPQVMKAHLIKSGKRALKRHGRQLVEYEGAALRQAENCWIKFNSHGRVMLDPETWERTEPSNSAIPNIDSINPNSLEKDEEKLMLINTVVYGYSLGDKTWGKFSVDQISDANWNDNAFKGLVLDENIKEFVHDLVSEHRSGDKKAFDAIVRDKGRGLVGLLAGPPGVGKTLTAEAISEISRRPLYMISSTDLGYLPTDIHKNLTRILELAEHWDAVVLLDEADCFLAARDNLDLSRNATVSVFLRELEYYQGILILTTNRATAIDKAFQSRIHFSLQYPDLDIEGRRAVWQNFITMAKRNDKLKMDIGEESLEALSALQLNGRQIKNAMSVAQTVALKRGKPMTLETIRTAMKLSQHAWLSEAEH